MTQTAYEADGKVVAASCFYEIACDPQRSVVVEACAGAGKTWMLVSRILRAWLEGVPPHRILAITFTRKAAGEMRERLHEWLSAFAAAPEHVRAHELRIRGVAEDRLPELVPRLAQIHAEWLKEGRGVEIHTIHGWFSRLVKAAPLDLLAEMSLPPELQLVEDIDEIWPLIWARFLKRLDAQIALQDRTEASAWPAFQRVVREAGRFNTENWLKTALHNRLEVTLADQAGVLDEGVASTGAWDARWAGWGEPVQALQQASVTERFTQLARDLGRSDKLLPQKAANALVDALAMSDLERRAEALTQALLTDKGEPRKKLGDAPDLTWAQDWLQDLQAACRQHEAHELHLQMADLSRLLFDEYAAFKRERGLADMADLELAAARLLSDEGLAGWVQQRLDSQVQQVLMDEFQDTSPLQWQALRTWLSAYAGAGGGGSGSRPLQVFLVGDPKQSIYRFRRADPRVFDAARRFVIEGLGGHLLACDHTRRNATEVIRLLNQVMGQAHAEGVFPGFRPHTTASEERGRVRTLPSVARSEAEAKTEEGRRPVWRDSLREPKEAVKATSKAREAHQVARAIAAMMVEEGLQPEDFFVLSRTRQTLGLVAQCLDTEGIPHIAPDNTPLIETPEVSDLLALVEALVSPHHDLALAQALRSPVFGASDPDLMALAARVQHSPDRPSWWQTLQQWRAQAGTSPDLAPVPAALSRAATLLARWQELATVLLPHDLLTRIVLEGEVRERLVASVPAGQRAQSLFHVDALLNHSLTVAAGRDLTPYSWVRILRQSVSELPPRAQGGAVQLLTIHGAKGLEAKVVCLLDTDPAPSRPMSHGLLIDWPEGASHPGRVAFVRSEAKPPPSLVDVFESERQAEQREELNALYVALTRAREQLLISRNEPARSGRVSWWTRLVGSGGIAPDEAWSLPPPAGDGSPSPLQLMKPAVVALPLLREQTALPAAHGSGGDEPGESVVRVLGQVVHRALEGLTVLPVSQRSDRRIASAVQAAGVSLGLPRGHWGWAAQQVRAVLLNPALQPWLDPDRVLWAGNEVAVGHAGQVLRIDRLVAVGEPGAGPGQRSWWVIDYKLSEQPQALGAYRDQMARYVAAVAQLQPGEAVKGAFITGSGEWILADDLPATPHGDPAGVK
jgi:ATP-dependent helicase/nuclease subunit A